MTAPIGILLATADGLVDLTEVVWQQVEPDGRITGIVTGLVGTSPVVTAEQAGRHLAGDDYDEHVADGVTWRPRSAQVALTEIRSWHRSPLPCGCDPDARENGHACLDRQVLPGASS